MFGEVHGGTIIPLGVGGGGVVPNNEAQRRAGIVLFCTVFDSLKDRQGGGQEEMQSFVAEALVHPSQLLLSLVHIPFAGSKMLLASRQVDSVRW